MQCLPAKLLSHQTDIEYGLKYIHIRQSSPHIRLTPAYGRSLPYALLKYDRPTVFSVYHPMYQTSPVPLSHSKKWSFPLPSQYMGWYLLWPPRKTCNIPSSIWSLYIHHEGSCSASDTLVTDPQLLYYYVIYWHTLVTYCSYFYLSIPWWPDIHILSDHQIYDIFTTLFLIKLPSL